MAIEIFGNPGKKAARRFAEALDTKCKTAVDVAKGAPEGSERRALYFLRADIFRALSEVVREVFETEGDNPDGG